MSSMGNLFAEFSSARRVEETFHGLLTHQISTAFGDELRVAEQGAHVLSWRSFGRERFYLSPQNAFDGKTAIRGGIPICFPQFNMRGHLPKHGFARNLNWKFKHFEATANSADIVFELLSNEITRQWWEQEFESRLLIQMTPGQLLVRLQVVNTDKKSLQFSGALHSYFAVDTIKQVTLSGLQNRPEWNAVTDVRGHGVSQIRFDSEFDRVYSEPAVPIHLRDAAHSIEITQSSSWGESVVWNPGEEKCATFTDMPANGYMHMLCVEAAQVYSPIELDAGSQWEGWQCIKVLDTSF
jgi:glucose-6-phosphate 1-epimerase